MKLYVVVVGRTPGIYTTWDACQDQVLSYPGAKFKSFFSRKEAVKYLNVQTIESLDKDKKIYMIPLYNKTKIYTCRSSRKHQGGYGLVVIKPNGEKIEDDGPVISEEIPSNQRSELFAIKKSLEITEGGVVIYTDSLYSIKCLNEWFHKWSLNGWVNSRNDPVANKDLIIEIKELMSDRHVEFVHVRGNAGIVLENRADRNFLEDRCVSVSVMS